MDYRTQVINGLIMYDEYSVGKWTKEISEIFKRKYNGTDKVSVYLLPTDLHTPTYSVYKKDGIICINTSNVPRKRYIMPEHLMYLLRYELAKRYSIVFENSPRSYYIDTKTYRQVMYITELRLRLQ